MSRGEDGMAQDTDIAVAVAKFQHIADDMAEVKRTMRELVDAVSKLAVLEERQISTNGAIDRAFKQLSSIDQGLDRLAARVSALEQAQPVQKQSSDLVQTLAKYTIVAVLGAVVAGLWRTPPTMPAQAPPAIVGR